MALAATSGVSSDLIFADRRRVRFSWSNNEKEPPPVQPVAPYPDVSAEFPGVTLERHIPTPPPPTKITKPNWVQLADEAADNTNLEFTDLLPPPPEVIIINDEDITPLPLTSQQSTQLKLEPPAASLLTSEQQSHNILPPSCYPSHVRRSPQHLTNDYLFTTVAEECHQPPDHPYHTAGGTVVDLAIKKSI
jgi:hypothetical protein